MLWVIAYFFVQGGEMLQAWHRFGVEWPAEFSPQPQHASFTKFSEAGLMPVRVFGDQ
jgi:hypothetical protein